MNVCFVYSYFRWNQRKKRIFVNIIFNCVVQLLELNVDSGVICILKSLRKNWNFLPFVVYNFTNFIATYWVRLMHTTTIFNIFFFVQFCVRCCVFSLFNFSTNSLTSFDYIASVRWICVLIKSHCKVIFNIQQPKAEKKLCLKTSKMQSQYELPMKATKET